ncbi:unnamed protein product [Linum trigynum]|uniref:Uncharacterized protein n=1 Tax=Linum trigynum TaxID=586398 RepID=A0AAV2FEK6_9ROSI
MEPYRRVTVALTAAGLIGYVNGEIKKPSAATAPPTQITATGQGPTPPFCCGSSTPSPIQLPKPSTKSKQRPSCGSNWRSRSEDQIQLA